MKRAVFWSPAQRTVAILAAIGVVSFAFDRLGVSHGLNLVTAYVAYFGGVVAIVYLMEANAVAVFIARQIIPHHRIDVAWRTEDGKVTRILAFSPEKEEK